MRPAAPSGLAPRRPVGCWPASHRARPPPRSCRAVAARTTPARGVFWRCPRTRSAAIKEIRAEFSGKIEALTAQVATLQRQLNVSRGEANILAQQNKDTARRLAEMGEQVAKLAVEVVGDDEAAATGALAGSA